MNLRGLAAVAVATMMAAMLAGPAAVADELRPTKTQVVTNRRASSYGHALHITARVRDAVTGDYVDGGTVTFFVDGAPIGSANVALGGAFPGVYRRLHAGTRSLTATYSGTEEYGGNTSSPVSHTVTPAVSDMRVTGYGPHRVYVRVRQVNPSPVTNFARGDVEISVDKKPAITFSMVGGVLRLPRVLFTRHQLHLLDVEFSNPFGDWTSDTVTNHVVCGGQCF